MVVFFESRAIEPPATIYMGKDKFENEDLIKYGFEEDVWFHVDKLSSAHVYLRMPAGMSWEAIPAPLLEHMGQLTKANSIEGNKKDNIQIIYTPWANVKKTGDMATGTVTFHNERKVKRVLVKQRENAIVNALNKTKKEIVVDHEAVRQDRLRQQGKIKKAIAVEEQNARLELDRARAADRQARDYSSLYDDAAIARHKREREIEKERARRLKAEQTLSASAEGGVDRADREDGEESDASSEGSFM